MLTSASAGINIRNLSVTLFRRTGITFQQCSDVTFENSTFSNIHSTSHSTPATDYIMQPTIILLIDTSITLYDCAFLKNSISSITAINSSITLEGNLVFSDNQALLGAVFLLTGSSKLSVSESCVATFHNNSAIDYGGVFYIITEETPTSSITLTDENSIVSVTNCFFHVENRSLDTRLYFSGNTAGKGGDVLFGGQVALGWDGDVNCLESFKKTSDLSRQGGTSVISSAPSRVCLCQDSQHDCLILADPTTHTIYPGETLAIPAVVVGQEFGTVTGSVIAQLMVPSDLSPTSDIYLKEEQSSVLFNNGPCTDLKYTIYTNCEECKAVLVLKTNNADVFNIVTTEDKKN